MESNLSATSAGGSQVRTQNPQTAGSGNFLPGDRSSSVQSGTPTSALTGNSSGITLGTSAPTVVNVDNLPASAKTASTSTNRAGDTPTRHHSPLGLGITALVVVIALILIWSATRPVKNTTD